jgi:hypothetical protein
MLNTFFQPLGTFTLQQAPQRIELLKRVNLHAIHGRVNATIDIAAGGGADGTLVTEGVQRLVQSLRVRLDGDDIVQGLTGRDLYHMLPFARASVVAATNLAAVGIQTTAIVFDFVLFFARPYLAQPILTVLPGSIIPQQELALYLQWDNAANAGAGSVAGTGVITTGGTRLCTWTVLPTISLVQEYSTAFVRPWFVPRITVRTTEQVNAANTQLPLILTDARPFDAVIHRWLENPASDGANSITDLSLLAGGGALRFWDSVPTNVFYRYIQGAFPGAATTGQAGIIHARVADNGLLGNAIDPRRLTDPRFSFNVAAPAVNPGFVRSIFFELQAMPGITQVPITPA